MTKVRFLKSPTGTHKLAYNVGEVGFVNDEVAKDLVNKGIATLVQEQSASVGFSDDKQGDTVKTQYKSTKSRKTNK
jgi:hypothetical protein